jgi:RNA polymerase sigma factor (sigma-70 family)
MGCQKNISAHMLSLIPALRAFGRSLCRQNEDVDDLVQETLTKALGAMEQFEPGTNLKSWLFTIMRNSFYTAKHKQSRERPGLEDCVSTTDIPCGAAQEWVVLRDEVGRALQALPENQRQAIVLVGVLERSYEEAAHICGCNIGTIKSRVNRARRRLADLVDDVPGRAAAAISRQRSIHRANSPPP